MTGKHYIRRCVCGRVLSQCRCASPNKEIIIHKPCRCAKPKEAHRYKVLAKYTSMVELEVTVRAGMDPNDPNTWEDIEDRAITDYLLNDVTSVERIDP